MRVWRFFKNVAPQTLAVEAFQSGLDSILIFQKQSVHLIADTWKIDALVSSFEVNLILYVGFACYDFFRWKLSCIFSFWRRSYFCLILK